MLKLTKFILFFILLLNIFIYSKVPVRIKDISNIEGIRENQLMGFGLVTGLQGTGDSKSFKLTKNMLKNLALNHGYNITESDIESKNIAAVLVTSKIAPFQRIGDTLNVSISSIGDCRSLEGGILLQTALRGADNIIYAVAQGKILAGTRSQNALTNASIPDGAIIEKNIISEYLIDNKINLILKYPDFTTANQIREQILTQNSNLQVNILDPGKVEITLTDEELRNPIDFISKFEVLTITPDYGSTVVIDKKTGIIVAGENLIIQECSISTPFAQVNIRNKKNNFQIFSQTVQDLVKLLNESGLNTDEIISILEGVHKIGALNGKLLIL
ncbi:MAG: flagellar basal body P-ring protein FlgI [Spirochaetes bacterium]|nr:flagellar basal body P-ring protein FlgI [Spirochaetota bacterium]